MAEKIKNVLWVHDEQLGKEELLELDRRRTVNLRQILRRVDNMEELKDDVEWADIIALYFDSERLSKFMEMYGHLRKPVIRPHYRRGIMLGHGGKEMFEFVQWNHVVEFKQVVKTWVPED